MFRAEIIVLVLRPAVRTHAGARDGVAHDFGGGACLCRAMQGHYNPTIITVLQSVITLSPRLVPKIDIAERVKINT